jgi:hypothetical protein
MKAFRLKKDSLGGGGWHRTAYTDGEVAKMVAAEMCQEWIHWKAVESEAEEIGGGRCIIDGTVYDLEATTEQEKLVETAMKKLSPKERSALGFGSVCVAASDGLKSV